MLDEKELKKTKRVNITGEIPNGRLQILDRFHINSYKKTFKYILKSKKWFICGNYDDIIKAHR